MVRLLARVIGVGIETADMLVREVLSRNLRDRKAVARYAGLTGSPDESGARRREKGLARVGNARVRRGMLQLAWRFLALPGGQPAGALVPGADRGRPRRDAQDHDRGPGPEAADRAVEAGDDRRGAGGCRPALGAVSGRPERAMRRSRGRSARP